MSEEKNAISPIDFEFTKSRDYKVIYVNGAFGGPAPQGEIMVDFFREYRELPEKVTHKIESGVLGDEISRHPPKPKFIREKEIGIVLTPEKAISIGKWLIEKAEEVMDLRKKIDKELK